MDHELRVAERRYLRGGGRVAVLRARLRAGVITRERVAAAAFLGDDDARALLGAEAPKLPGPLVRPQPHPEWDFGRLIPRELVPSAAARAAALVPFGAEVCVRAARAAISSLPLLEWCNGGEAEAGAVLAGIEDWIACPCAAHAEACDATERPMLAEADRLAGEEFHVDSTGSAMIFGTSFEVARVLAVLACVPSSPDLVENVVTLVAKYHNDAEETWAPVPDAVIPWALGEAG